MTDKDKEMMKKRAHWKYPKMEKTLGPFHLTVEEGTFGGSETVVMLGQNGTGKTTMIKLLAGLIKADDASIEIPPLNISYKPQTIAPKFEGQVQDLFNMKLKDVWTTSIFKTEVIMPLHIEELLENDV
jgi:ATP-binding cassette subfamily E protein 1